MEKQELWRCRICCADKAALPTKYGKAKIAAFRTGFVGVQLTCGHWAAVRQDKVQHGITYPR